ncbi:hypothetical protein CXF67_03650 [Psychroflexus sp. MES1-P1E]|nr:hypothetical protein CXF67_03650 [Psychroflexus sp. MES1-P1E]
MKRSLIIILLLIFNLTLGQEKIDPTESLISEFKSQLEIKKVSEFFVLKHVTYGSSHIFDLDDPNSCSSNRTYFTMYAFWKKGNNNYIKKFDNCGAFNSIKLANSKPNEFYQNNFENLKSEKVKPYQTSPDSIANGLVYKSISSASHQPQRYFWFYKNSQEYTNHFDKYNLTTKKENPNLNFKTNADLSIVKLNAISEEIINEMNDKELFKRLE